MRKIFPAACAILAAAAGCKSHAAIPKNAIVVGEVGSMTGPEATFGVSSDKGIRLALQQINAAGGVRGRPLAVISEDDEGKPEEVASVTSLLISHDHVAALLGEVASTRSLMMAPIAQRARVPMISPSSTNPKVTQVGDYIFRVCFIDPFQGYVMAKFAHDQLHVDHVAIFKDMRNDYSVGLAKFFEQTFSKLGGRITGDYSYSAGDVDFRAQLTSMKAGAPQAIFVPGYYTDVGLIARQARELGLAVPLLGGDGWDSAKLYQIGGPALDGSYFSNHYSVDDPGPRVQRFVAAYKAAWRGELPDSLAAMAYDATEILADAMRRAPSLSGPALRDAIAATRDFPGVTGTITIDAQRNAQKPAVVLQIEHGGAYRFVTRIFPEQAPAAPAPAAAVKALPPAHP